MEYIEVELQLNYKGKVFYMQMALILDDELTVEQPTDNRPRVHPFKKQLLKWIGNKQRFAHEIVGMFPAQFGTYYEPFLGSGAVLGTLSPFRAVASDAFAPLMEIWSTLKSDHTLLEQWYTERWELAEREGKEVAYERVKASYNAKPNGADFVFLARTCYGGVVRFRQADGYMSTPCGPHNPISPTSFSSRVIEWKYRVRKTEFMTCDFEESMSQARAGDLVYCDPPYSFSQAILYGAQNFSIERLLRAIARCKERGVYVVLSIDGSKKSGNMICDVPLPKGLFEREVAVNVGRSMLKRFQMEGQTLESEVVSDRLLLTY
jgi:DNA adenine methylase